MVTRFRITRLLPLFAASLAFFAAACASNDSTGSTVKEQVSFAATPLAVTAANPGEVISVDIVGSQSAINRGFFLRITDANRTLNIPPLRVENGRAFVIVPGLTEEQPRQVGLSLVNDEGEVVSGGPSLVITPVRTSLVVSRALFNAAVGEGLARVLELAREAVVTLDQNGYLQNAQVALDAFAQYQVLLRGIEDYTSNLDDVQLGMLQQILGNAKLLDFLAQAGGVALGGSASQQSAQHSALMQMIESALLKADFASLLLGEARGMLNMIAWACAQVSSWPIIGQTAQAVGSWAQGLSATLKAPQDFINTMIPSDLVKITAPSTLHVIANGSAPVIAKGRFETEGPFNTQWLQQTIAQYTGMVVTQVTQLMQGSTLMAPYVTYVQQMGAQIPGWIMNWLTSKGLLSASVVPGQNYTVLSLNNLNLDMAQYRFDIAGITANLLNLPRNIVTTFFTWVGIGYGSPVGGFEGVKVTGSSVSYDIANDKLTYVANGTSTATYIGVLCRPATGWWAQWGFYAVNQKSVNVTVYAY